MLVPDVARLERTGEVEIGDDGAAAPAGGSDEFSTFEASGAARGGRARANGA
jgi:hypothetical protein